MGNTMKIGLHHKFSTYNNKWGVHWGTTGNAYNQNSKFFSKKVSAKMFVKNLMNKYARRYKINYLEL